MSNPYEKPKSNFIVDENPMEQPRCVSISIFIHSFALFLGIVSGIWNIHSYTQPEYQSTTYLGLLVFGFFYFGLIVLISRKKNWARIVVTAIAIFGFIALLLMSPERYDIMMSERLLSFVSNWLQRILQISAVILLYLPSSNVWYKSKKYAAL